MPLCGILVRSGTKGGEGGGEEGDELFVDFCSPLIASVLLRLSCLLRNGKQLEPRDLRLAAARGKLSASFRPLLADFFLPSLGSPFSTVSTEPIQTRSITTTATPISLFELWTSTSLLTPVPPFTRPELGLTFFGSAPPQLTLRQVVGSRVDPSPSQGRRLHGGESSSTLSSNDLPSPF
jgi:hypothetical protein